MDRSTSKAAARAAIVAAYFSYHWAAVAGGQRDTLVEFVALYNEGRSAAHPKWRAVIPTLTRISLRRWAAKVQAGQPLKGGHGNRLGTSYFETQHEVREAVIEIVRARPHIFDSDIIDELQRRFPKRPAPPLYRAREFAPEEVLPTMATLRRFLASLARSEGPKAVQRRRDRAGKGRRWHKPGPNH